MSLQRFLDAQDSAYPNVIRELESGHKVTHWMWYIFPQHARLDSSPTAKFYALDHEHEPREYIEHGVLGPRLKRCTRLVLGVNDVSKMFPWPDTLKFETCMRIFAQVSDDPIFDRAIDLCEKTIPEEHYEW